MKTYAEIYDFDSGIDARIAELEEESAAMKSSLDQLKSAEHEYVREVREYLNQELGKLLFEDMPAIDIDEQYYPYIADIVLAATHIPYDGNSEESLAQHVIATADKPGKPSAS